MTPGDALPAMLSADAVTYDRETRPPRRLGRRRGALPRPRPPCLADHLRRAGRAHPRRGPDRPHRPRRRRPPRRFRGADSRPRRGPDLERAPAHRRPAPARRRRGAPHRRALRHAPAHHRQLVHDLRRQPRRRPGRSAPRASPRTPTAQRLYFENARLEAFGVPIAYLPRLSIPEPGVARANGLLPPDLPAVRHLRLRLQVALLPRARARLRRDDHPLRHHRGRLPARGRVPPALLERRLQPLGRRRPRRHPRRERHQPRRGRAGGDQRRRPLPSCRATSSSTSTSTSPPT